MHKKPPRSTFNPLRQKIEAPEHLSALQDYQCKQGESSARVRLPSLHRRRSARENDNNGSTWDKQSTTESWSPELEDVVTSGVVEQWEAIERTLYDEEDQVQQTALLEECIQWRSQIPHLRILGRNTLAWARNRANASKPGSAAGQSSNVHSDDLFSEHSFTGKDSSVSSRQKSLKKAKDEVFNKIADYVMSELFPNKENKSDTLEDSLDNVLRIRPATLHSSRSSARSKRNSWSEENPLNCFLETYTEQDDFALPVGQSSVKSSAQEARRKTKAPENAERKAEREDSEDENSGRASRSLATRNKLGTVFNEKIVVSPVPYVLSTRESFCTLRTTPIKFMPQPLTSSALPGAGRTLTGFKYPARNSVAPKMHPDGYSAWHAPVCPAVWPKNLKLAPIDTSRLPRSKNRSATQSPVLRCNRQSLSPIQRPGLSVSAYTIRKNSSDKKASNNDFLQIQARHITPGERPKQSACKSGKDYRPGIDSRRTKSRGKPDL